MAETKGLGYELIWKFDMPTTINHIMIMEDIQYGELIRKYKVEGKVNGEWRILTEGESVEHKRIQKFDKVEVRGIR
ncbi:hypothetical protein [Maribacter ulvicola]|uniref:Alpha-L-fucosidase n=1 Tax=Maribacter ulvicola TaxID=228959 RepID=A0A1N6X7N4_9FLAO|nr:hypothetical protein [Maribacter ulvicola]SIQ98358.1 alpha-L-fucosidase [Maribacter ulvicola]